MATLGVQCQNPALGMASLGLFCGAAVQPPQAAPGLGGSGGGSGSWYWISDLETPKKTLRIKRVKLPATDLDRSTTEQILREDDELLLLVIALIESGVV
jgi:hypothetical protein